MTAAFNSTAANAISADATPADLAAPPPTPARDAPAASPVTSTVERRPDSAGPGEPWLPDAEDRTLSLLGVRVTDVARGRALAMLRAMLAAGDGRARSVFFVNTHTLNCAAAEEAYRRLLNRADLVFGDGTGVRWAARLQGVRVRANLCGTDLMPQLMRDAAAPLRYFLLGGNDELVARAAETSRALFPNCTLVGFHHGYVGDVAANCAALEAIRRAAPDLLLVGMGNPLQERWIDANLPDLSVPLCAGVGGLFHYWAGDLRRAPRWLRRLGAEWLGILCQQPHKAARYLVGNPRFLARIVADRLRRGRGAPRGQS